MALASTPCTCTIRPAWMQRARTPAVAVHGILRNTSMTSMSPAQGLSQAGPIKLAQGVPAYHNITARQMPCTRAIDGAHEDQQPSLWSWLRSALRVAAMFGVAITMLLGNTNPAFATAGGDTVKNTAYTQHGPFSTLSSHDRDYKLDCDRSSHNTTVTYYITVNNNNNNNSSSSSSSSSSKVNKRATSAATPAIKSTQTDKPAHELDFLFTILLLSALLLLITSTGAPTPTKVVNATSSSNNNPTDEKVVNAASNCTDESTLQKVANATSTVQDKPAFEKVVNAISEDEPTKEEMVKGTAALILGLGMPAVILYVCYGM